MKKYDYVEIRQGKAQGVIGRYMSEQGRVARIRLGPGVGHRVFSYPRDGYAFRLLQVDKDLYPGVQMSFRMENGQEDIRTLSRLTKTVEPIGQLQGIFKSFPAPVCLEGWRILKRGPVRFMENIPRAVEAEEDKKREEERVRFRKNQFQQLTEDLRTEAEKARTQLNTLYQRLEWINDKMNQLDPDLCDHLDFLDGMGPD